MKCDYLSIRQKSASGEQTIISYAIGLLAVWAVILQLSKMSLLNLCSELHV